MHARFYAQHEQGKLWFILSDTQMRLTQPLLAECQFWRIPTLHIPNQSIDDEALRDPEADAQRLIALHQLSQSASTQIIFTSCSALGAACPSPNAGASQHLNLALGEELEPEAFAKQLGSLGYEQVAQVHNRGQFAIRGGIIDLFTWSAKQPLRIELFDAEIDSLRYFDIHTQTSTQKTNYASLQLAELENDSTLSAYIHPSDLIVSFDFIEELPTTNPRLLLSPNPSAIDGEADYTNACYPSPLGGFEPGNFVLQENKRHQFTQQIADWQRQGWRTLIAFANKGELERFTELMGDATLTKLITAFGHLSKGFTIPSLRLAVLSSAELFGRHQTAPTTRKSHLDLQRQADAKTDIKDIQPGDLVVHSQYGIGRFLKISCDNDGLEEIHLCYLDGAILSVPVDQAHLLAKYIGMGGKEPKLNKLGDAKWGRTRVNAEKSILDYAAQLLRVQAQRDSQPTDPHPPDSKWMWEFEHSFPYTETPDQLRAIHDVKADMESHKPMDRLICGDVGFGKTEVAIRAAFKSVTSGKQAALLVPTTVLAEQHFRTFQQRMSDYPIKIALLNRFRKPSEVRETLKGLANGSIDIVIGTHRLVSKDVSFHDLGVAIIDEEQRFGVKHKERFKQLFSGIDVLTLSATPIPRTLYLSLMGTRDMSTIDTPPPNKVPVQTTIANYDERIIRSAIERELARGGQIFFLHNRVQTIEIMAEKIQDLVPQASIVVGHGQMEKDQLELVMQAFVNGEKDILLATTIIESGIDIPNANTIIIDRADRFGLADLYQLRGRVGRGGQHAHAILLLPRKFTSGANARKRIDAIKQYTALGSGFKIAMRDLEIRGAGNLLGTKQSGHIAAVGFDLYCQLLKQSIQRLRGEAPSQRSNVTLRVDFLSLSESEDGKGLHAYIPHDYMTEPTMRIRAYKQLAEASAEKQLQRITRDWEDQFGKLPTPLTHLITLTNIKIAAAQANISSVELKHQRLMLTRNGEYILLAGSRFPRLEATQSEKKLAEALQLLKTI